MNECVCGYKVAFISTVVGGGGSYTKFNQSQGDRVLCCGIEIFKVMEE